MPATVLSNSKNSQWINLLTSWRLKRNLCFVKNDLLLVGGDSFISTKEVSQIDQSLVIFGQEVGTLKQGHVGVVPTWIMEQRVISS